MDWIEIGLTILVWLPAIMFALLLGYYIDKFVKEHCS